MRRRPTERQAARAARQLHYHRERLRWIENRMRDNEALLLTFLSQLEGRATVLPGGYRISGVDGSAPRSVAIKTLTPKSSYEQLVLRWKERESAGGADDALRDSPAGEESRKATPKEVSAKSCNPRMDRSTLTESAADASTE